MIEDLRKDVDILMSNAVQNQLSAEITELPINEDTIYKIIYDVYENEEQKYLYIKMVENTAISPFYYNRSYTLDELYKLHDIFKCCDINEIKNHLRTLFEKNKIKLSFDKNESIIKMELDTILFATNYKIDFLLYREMVPEEQKDQLSLDLYSINKQKLKMIKEMKAFLEQFNGNQDQNKIIDDLIQKIISFDIPGVESKKEIKKIKPKKEMEEIIEINDNKSIERSIMSDIKSETKIPNMYKNVKKGSYRFYKDKDNAPINLIIQNTTNKSWPENKIKLVCNKELSEIMPSKIDNFKYEIGIGQDGDFSLHFDQKDLKEGKYKIFIELYLNGNKIPDSECPITIRVKPNK